MYVATALLAACATTSPFLPAAETSLSTTTSSAPAAARATVPPAPSQGSALSVQIAALRNLVEQQNRLYTVAAPILMSNFAVCKRNAQNVTGFIAKTQFSYPAALAGAAMAAIGLDERLQIVMVFPGSGAQESGLLPGDVLLAVGDSKIAPGPNAERDGAKLIDAAGRGRTAIVLGILRGATPLTINLPLSQGCAFDIELGNTDNANAYTDGRRVMLTRGMLNFARSDEDLAFIVAKEIAHGVLTQTARSGMRATIDRLMLSQVATTVRSPALQPYVPVSDATADKLALYMLARANGEVDNALSFWQRLAMQYPANVANGYTALHPATVYRLSVMKAVLATIKLKKSNNLPLIP